MKTYKKVNLHKIGSIEDFTLGSNTPGNLADFYTELSIDCNNFVTTFCSSQRALRVPNCSVEFNVSTPEVSGQLYLVTISDANDGFCPPPGP